jgi:hypothetical protein
MWLNIFRAISIIWRRDTRTACMQFCTNHWVIWYTVESKGPNQQYVTVFVAIINSTTHSLRNEETFNTVFINHFMDILQYQISDIHLFHSLHKTHDYIYHMYVSINWDTDFTVMQWKCTTKHYYFNTYWASMPVASTYGLYIQPPHRLTKREL